MPCATAPCATTCLSLNAVLADGTLLNTGQRARKSASGYDLTRLLIGSEGTLGIITELTLKLHGIPETILSAVCPFATIEGACNATIAAMQMGLPLARIELADEVQIRACNAYSHLTFAEAADAVSRVSRHAPPPRASRSRPSPRSRVSEGGGEFAWAERPEDRSKLWQARHDAYWAARRLASRRRGGRPPMSACRSRRLPLASARPAPTSTGPACSPRSSAMSATAISMSCRCSMPADAEERRKVQGFLDRLIERALLMARHLQRRAWRGPGQDPLSRARAWRRRRGDDCHKKGARSVEYP